MKWRRVTQATVVCFNGEVAKSRETKSNKEGKDAFFSELLERPHCPDLGPDQIFRGLYRARNQSIGWDGHHPELGRQSGPL